MTITREMLEARRESILGSLLQLQGALDCIAELLEADAKQSTEEVDDELEEDEQQ